MLSCKEVSRLVSESMDRNLSLWQRVNLRIHLSMCRLCSGFGKDLNDLREAARQQRDEVEREPGFADSTLSAEARERIQQAMERHDWS